MFISAPAHPRLMFSRAIETKERSSQKNRVYFQIDHAQVLENESGVMMTTSFATMRSSVRSLLAPP